MALFQTASLVYYGNPDLSSSFFVFFKVFSRAECWGVCGFARSFWRSIECAATPSVSKLTAPPPMAQGSLGWFHCAGGAVRIGGVYCGTPGTAFPTVGFVRVRLGAAGIGWGVLRNGTEAVPYGRISYAERELANSRESPKVLFDHRPNRTNCQPALPGRRADASDWSGGFCSPSI